MKTRAVTEGAMTAVIIVLLSLLNFTFGFFSFLIPVPLAVIVFRHNLRTGMLVSFASAAVASLVFVTPLIGLDILIVGFMGIVLGLVVKENFSFTRIFLIGVGAAALSLILRLTALALIADYNLIADFTQLWNNMSEQMLSMWQHMEMSPDLLAQYKEVFTSMPSLFAMLIPIYILVSSLLETILCLLVLNIVMKRFGVAMPKFSPFIHWKLPWYFVWGYIISKALTIVHAYFPNQVFQAVVVNIDIFFSGAFFIQGLAILWFYLTQAEIRKSFRILITIFLLLTGNVLIYNILVMLGVLDTWFDVRKLNRVDKEAK
ncbi:MAG: YybS family protein [Candidatus Wallacebacter cryptica]|nr:DUF2232 domain-containing protein [Bacillota bacterium]